MVKKSKRNVLACTQVHLIETVLSRLAGDADAVLTELLVELLGFLATFSITVKEMKLLLSLLKSKNGAWVCNSEDWLYFSLCGLCLRDLIVQFSEN